MIGRATRPHERRLKTVSYRGGVNSPQVLSAAVGRQLRVTRTDRSMAEPITNARPLISRRGDADATFADRPRAGT